MTNMRLWCALPKPKKELAYGEQRLPVPQLSPQMAEFSLQFADDAKAEVKIPAHRIGVAAVR